MDIYTRIGKTVTKVDRMKENERIGYMDIGAGVMILWLLCYHALFMKYETSPLVVIPWFFYFMPWFFYKSGYFFSQKPVLEGVRKDARKLLLPFVFWSAIGYVGYLILHVIYNGPITVHEAVYVPIRSFVLLGSIPINMPLLFLVVLPMVHVSANILCKRVNALVVAIVSMVVATGLHLMHWAYMPRIIYAMAWGVCFFCAGNWLRKYEQNVVLVVVSVIILVVTILYTPIPGTYDIADSLPLYWYVGWYPASIAGCVVLNNVSRWIDKVPNYVLKWVGRHAMTFYVMHGIVCVVIQKWLAHNQIEWYRSTVGLIIVFVAYLVVIVPICIIKDRRLKNEN